MGKGGGMGVQRGAGWRGLGFSAGATYRLSIDSVAEGEYAMLMAAILAQTVISAGKRGVRHADVGDAEFAQYSAGGIQGGEQCGNLAVAVAQEYARMGAREAQVDHQG